MDLKYNKFYIGLSKDGKPFNFAWFRPLKNSITLSIYLPRSDDIDAKIDQSGLETLDYDARRECYRLSLHKDNISKHRALLKELMQAAYQSRSM